MPFNKCFPCLQIRNEEVVSKLDFSNTTLTDVFPDVWQYERTLEELYLTSTRINALPPQLFYCQGLRVLMVNNNNLETIPNAIGSLRQLQCLNLSRNLISSVPDNVKSCKNLTRLDLSYNNLQRLPEAITCLISLQELLLNETYLEFLPANFGRLVHLKILELRLNNLMTLPKSMARLTNLQRLDIGGNEFSSLPDVIGELKQLRELWFDFNQIRSITPNIAKLRELQHLEANGNLIESLPNEVSNWRNMEVLSICNNSLSTFPFNIGMLKTLVTLKCESNGLRELPDSISNLENLEELVLSHNKLVRLPATVGMLKKLRFIFVDDNQLVKLPDEICNCRNLSVLSVSSNQLSALPNNIGQLRKLKVFNIVNNCISTLPVSVLGLVNLTSLWISDNQSQPLVPLQYLDSHTKTELTCFMLPQQNSRSILQSANDEQQQQQPQKFIQDLSNASSFQYDQSVNDIKYNANSSQNLNLKRICFADEPTVVDANTNATAQIEQGSKDHAIYDNNASAALDEQLGVRLMRSPTPYPKELRLMAKYIRQNKPKVPQSPSETSLVNINEPRQACNINSESINCDTIINNLDTYEDQSQHSISVKENTGNGNNKFDHCTNTVYITPVQYAEIYGINQFQHQPQLSTPQYAHSQISDNPAIEQNYLQSNNYQQNSNVISDYQFVNHSLYYSMLNASVNNYNESLNCAISNDSSSQMETQTVQNTLPNPGNQNSFTMEPPPYHIARIYTKKSPEDLTSYDTIRNLHKQAEIMNTQNVDSVMNQNTLHNNTYIFDDRNESNMSPTALCDNQKFPNLTASMKDLNLSNTIEANYQNQQMKMDQQEPLNRATSSVSISDDNYSIYNSNSNIVDRANFKRTPWLFGVHKNPTVKQVILKWENHIGFSIDRMDNQEGIYVSSITENTNAARLLSINDKLLEVDGYDFSNITVDEAIKVLMKAGPAINIMLSRK